MYCKQCGAELVPGAIKCPRCGAIQEVDDDLDSTASLGKVRPGARFEVPEVPVEDEAKAASVQSNEVTPGFAWTDADDLRYATGEDEPEIIGAPRYTPSRYAVREEQPGPSRVHAVLVTLGVVAVLGVVGFGILYVVQNRSALFGDESMPRVTSVVTGNEAAGANAADAHALPIWVPWLDAEGSRVPVMVRGTTVDGTKVDEVAYVEYDGSGLELSAGSYKVKVVGSPISSDGVIYETTDDTLRISVGMRGEYTFSSTVLTLNPIEATEVTDGQIEEALEWAKGDEKVAKRADDLAKAVRDRRETVLNAQVEQLSNQRRKAEEEASKKEDEEAKKKEEE